MRAYLREHSKKSDRISEIKERIETAFSCKIDYCKVYHEFRRIYPHLGTKDCENFLKFLDENGSLHLEETKPCNESLCKLFFQTKAMYHHYEKFGDIVLIDTTYNTNHYSIPLVIISGIDNN